MFANYSTESPSSSESSRAQEHWGFWGVIHLKMPWQGFTAIQEGSSFASWHSRLLPRGGLLSDLQLLKMQEAFRVDLLSFPPFQSQSTQLDSSVWRAPPALRPAEDTQLMRGQPCPQGASIPAKEMKSNEGECLNKMRYWMLQDIQRQRGHLQENWRRLCGGKKKKKDIGNTSWKKGLGSPPNSSKSTHENSRTSGFKPHSIVGKKSSPQHLPERGCFVNLSKSLRCLGFPGGASGKKTHLPMQKMQETWVWFLGREDPLQEGTATHSNIVDWRIPWTEEPDRLRSIGSQRVRHNSYVCFPNLPLLSYTVIDSTVFCLNNPCILFHTLSFCSPLQNPDTQMAAID